ncbi:hypothetical protein AB6A40_010482 [Gnathostoma spinigerum]|uniref:Peptidase M12B domain-containing protein n=1 Tax=Gnathostoma spinigerum TaxID=75299 RepID=A0ABD6F1U1_9BILA
MSFGVECPVHITFNSSVLTASELISISQNTPVLTLSFENEFRESVVIRFQRNFDVLPQDGRKMIPEVCVPGTACQWKGFSSDESSALSTCSMLELGGLLTINGQRYILATKPNQSFILSPQSSNNCRWISNKWRKRREIDHIRVHSAEYYSKYLDGKRRYVELALVADSSVFVKYGKNVSAVHERLATIANYVDSVSFFLEVSN